MARAKKKQEQGTDAAGNEIPAEWKAAIDKSAADVEALVAKAKPDRMTGVVVENGVSYVLEPIDPTQMVKDAHELAALLEGRAKMNADRKLVAAAFKSKLADLDERIKQLGEEVQTGMRKRPAQRELEV